MNTLTAGQSLNPGEALQSDNGKYSLQMQGDGNLVEYEGAASIESAIWASGTSDLPSFMRPVRADMQDDGNLVLYAATGTPAWASGTDGNPGSRLVVQDDRNLAIYNASGAQIWANHKTANGVDAAPVRAFEAQDVGFGKRMETEAILYRDGLLAVSTFGKVDAWFTGLRGRVLVICVDSGGRSIWVSQELRCTTRCSVLDPSCASYGRDSFVEHFPAEVGAHTATIDILQADEASFVDLRQKLIEVIKAAEEIAPAVKAVLGALY